MSLTDFLLKQGKSILTRTVSGVAVNQGKKAISKLFEETSEQTKARAKMILGYDSNHWTVGAHKDINFKCSPIFVHEWLTKAPENKNRVIRDEETGEMYLDGKLLSSSNDLRMSLINSFLDKTKVKSAAVVSHFDNAWKLFQPEDVMAHNFRNFFAGADVSKGTPVIDGWLQNCFGDGIDGDMSLNNFLFKHWIVGTAKRAIKPGETLDGCLVLTGTTNLGKTRFFRYLLCEPFDKRTTEIYGDIKDPRKFVEGIIGKTVVCFDELSSLEEPKVIEQWKSLISSQSIQVRLAWRRDAQRYGLRQGFCATTNKEKFITDPTLSRRMWVIKLNGKAQLNFDYFNANKKALWQEAIAMAQTDYNTYLMPKDCARVEDYNKQFYIEKTIV